LFGRKRKSDDFGAEIDTHLQLEFERQRDLGLSEEDARAAARRGFGNVMQARERFYESGRWVWLEDFWQDVRYGLRSLRKTPGFTAVAVLTLALGIGANTAIFSVIENVMLRPLPFTASDQLVRIYSTQNGSPINPNGAGSPGGPSVMDMRDFAQNNRTFQSMVVYDTWRKNVSFGLNGAQQPEEIWVGLAPAAYFTTLEVNPIMGRLFTENESYTGKHYVAAISERLWKNRYGGDAAILGKSIRINDEPYTIIAVMPDVIPEWMDYREVQIWTPFGFADVRNYLWTEAGRRDRGWYTLGRLKAGVPLEQAKADLSTIAAGLAATHEVDHGLGVALMKLSDTREQNLRPMLFLLMGAASLILLIACVNLANLFLARNSTRKRELAMRASLGASKGRIVRQLLSETLMLSLIGGGLGLLLAKMGVAALTTMHPANLPQLSSLRIDWRVLIFTILVSLATSLGFGLGPAFMASRQNLVESLKLGPRAGTSGSSGGRMRTALIVAEMAMSLILIVGASLLVQSILHLNRQQLGIRADHLLTAHFYLPPVRYPNPQAIARFSDQFADQVRSVPGVREASITTVWPPSYNWSQMFEIPGRPATGIQEIPSAQCGFTDAHFLRTMGIPLIRGRDFNDSDNATSSPVVLVSQEFVRRYFPNQDPIGLGFHIGPPASLNITPGTDITDSADVTIVGVIGDFRNSGLTTLTQPQIIALYSQHPFVTYGFRDIAVRTAADPHLMIPELARQLQSMDAELPFTQTRTIEEIVEQQTGSQRFATILLGLFAGIGVALAAVGIYGVVSFLVGQRKNELAVRLAVGASVTNLLWLVLKEGLKMALMGACIGLLGAWAAHKLLGALLFGISPVDPLTFAGATLFLCAVVLIACWTPARRAARVDPCLALRAE
jgi:putative ABC transport system permease protein